MLDQDLIAVVLGSALVSSIVAALIGGLLNATAMRANRREGRLSVAVELTRLNQERNIEAGRNTPGAEVTLPDPADVLRFYLANLDALERERKTLSRDWRPRSSSKAD